MTIKEFTKEVVDRYLAQGNAVDPDITLHVFQFIEKDEELLKRYFTLESKYPGINPTMGRMIRAYLDLRNDKQIAVFGECGLLKSYKRFHKRV